MWRHFRTFTRASQPKSSHTSRNSHDMVRDYRVDLSSEWVDAQQFQDRACAANDENLLLLCPGEVADCCHANRSWVLKCEIIQVHFFQVFSWEGSGESGFEEEESKIGRLVHVRFPLMSRPSFFLPMCRANLLIRLNTRFETGFERPEGALSDERLNEDVFFRSKPFDHLHATTFSTSCRISRLAQILVLISSHGSAPRRYLQRWGRRGLPSPQRIPECKLTLFLPTVCHPLHQMESLRTGDADGICSLVQIRLANPMPEGSGPGTHRLVTGVKRDIELVDKANIAAGDSVTVLDISLDKNRTGVVDALAKGCKVLYIDHHFAGEIPDSADLTTRINEDPAWNTALLTNEHLGGKFPLWAAVGAFGDNVPVPATKLAKEAGLSDEQVATLDRLGMVMNYNGYGESRMLGRDVVHLGIAFCWLTGLPGTFDRTFRGRPAL